MPLIFVLLILLFGTIQKTLSLSFCESKNEVQNGYAFKQHNINFPASTRFYQSASLEYSWHLLIEKKIRGHDRSISDLISILHSNECEFVFWGDTTLMLALHLQKSETVGRLSAYSTCNIEQLIKICNSTVGDSKCITTPNKPDCVLIGDPLGSNSFLDKYTILLCGNDTLTERRFRPDLKFSYDSLEMGVFSNVNNKIILTDIAGNGINNLCSRLITTSYEYNNAISHLRLGNSGFYEIIQVADLIARQFAYSSDKLRTFVHNVVSNDVDNKKISAMYFCETFYDGLWMENPDRCVTPLTRNEGSDRRLSLLRDGDPELCNLLQNSLYEYLEENQFTKSPQLTTQYYTRATKPGEWHFYVTKSTPAYSSTQKPFVFPKRVNFSHQATHLNAFAILTVFVTAFFA